MKPLSRQEERAVVAFADGARADPTLAERIAASPRLLAAVADQRRSLAATAQLREAAPPTLRARIEDARPRARPRRRSGGLSVALAGAGVVALTVVAVLPGGRGPSVKQAAAVATRGARSPAPQPDARHPGALRASVGGVRYPYWEDIAWRATGARRDVLGGHAVETVFYTGRRGESVAYTIVGGGALPAPAGTLYLRSATRYETLRAGSRSIVTWRRGGHTCVLSSAGVSVTTLLALASSRDSRT